MKKELEDSVKLIPEFYYDIIGRLVPGLIVTGAYLFDDIRGDLPALLVGGILVVSYFLGLILDKISYFLLMCILRKSLLLSFNSQWRKWSKIPDWHIWRWIHAPKTSSYSRTISKKLMAERALIRSLLLIGILWACPILRPDTLEDIQLWFVLAGVGLLLAAHRSADIALCSQFHNRVRYSKSTS